MRPPLVFINFASNCSAFVLAVNDTALEFGVGHAKAALVLTTGSLLLFSNSIIDCNIVFFTHLSSQSSFH